MNRTSLNRTYAEKSASTVLVTDQDRLPARLSGGREREVMYVRMTRLPGSLTAMVGRARRGACAVVCRVSCDCWHAVREDKTSGAVW
jgi:hypothetical protein